MSSGAAAEDLALHGLRVLGFASAVRMAYGTVMVVRVVRTRIEATAETLVVHDPWRSHRLGREEITAFGTGERIGHQRTYAELRGGGAVRLVVLEPQLPLPGRDRAVRTALDRLEAWRTSGRAAPDAGPATG